MGTQFVLYEPLNIHVVITSTAHLYNKYEQKSFTDHNNQQQNRDN